MFPPRSAYPLSWALYLLATSLLNGSDLIDRVSPVPADEQIPVADFFRPDRFSNPALNPSGTHVAALVPVDSRRRGLVITDLTNGEVKIVRGAYLDDIREFWWMTDELFLFNATRENSLTAGLYVGDQKARNYALESFNACRLVGLPLKNPLLPIIWMEENIFAARTVSSVMQIDSIKSARRKMMESENTGPFWRQRLRDDFGINTFVTRNYPQPDGDAVRYLADRDGELEFVISSVDGDQRLFRLEDRKWVECPVDLDEVSVVEPGDRPGELIVLGPTGTKSPRPLVRLDSVTGEIGEVIYQDPKYDLTAVDLVRNPKTQDLMGIRIWGLGMKTVWLDERMKEVQQLLESDFPGQVVSIIDSDMQQDRFLFATVSDREPPVYRQLDLEKNRLGLVKASAPWIDPKRTRPMRAIGFKSRDGKDLEGFLTLPDGASTSSPAPLIVLAHDGPWESDSWGWDPEAQFLASRGYAVFKPNYRGSTGYEWEFDVEETFDFRKMHEDVTDGVRSLIQAGLVDPDRIAILGSSFGGYLALCGAAFEPELYKCAISVAGVFDWEQLLGEIQQDEGTRARYNACQLLVGDPEEQANRFESNSPLSNAGDIKVPVFVAEGDEGVAVSIGQSQGLVRALEDSDVEHVVHNERFEEGGLIDMSARVELYEAIEQFLGENLQGSRPAQEVSVVQFR